ncbi:MAG: hypothetical protein BWY75_02657 [bacterium ADurb.Bin425]|nr:MAG: hypothetical protein BWY75_02657 [bacterium ADurb.Bin425]
MQQDVEDIRMGFLDFIEEHNRIRLATYLLGKLTAFLIANITGRRANQLRSCVVLHKFGHVDTDHVVFRTKEITGQSLSQLSFTHPGRTREDKGADRTVWILQADTGTANGFANRFNGIVLTDDALVQDIRHMQETLRFTFGKLEQGNTGPSADHMSHFFCGNNRLLALLLGLPSSLNLADFFRELGLSFAQIGCLFELLVANRHFFIAAYLTQLFFHFFAFRRQRAGAQPYS